MRLLLATLLSLVLLASGAHGPARADARPVKREILALYDSRYEKEPHLTRIHRFAEMPLNHLGYAVVYADIEKGLPDAVLLARYAGVLTWFDRPVTRLESYVQWALLAGQRGLKIVILGTPGAGPQDAQVETMNALLAHIGLRETGNTVSATFGTKVMLKDSAMIEFERPLDPALPAFDIIKALESDVVAHLKVAGAKGERGFGSILVATSPRGGFAAEGFTIAYEPLRDRVNWILNPFEFFRLALGERGAPIPDVTTHMGRRIYFSHIDGDGWNNVTEIERYRGTSTLSAEVVRRELIAPFPDLPVTVGLVAGDVDPEIGGDPLARPIARALYALPQVEVASHTYTHPYNWQFFERYNREQEIALIDKRGSVDKRLYERAIGELLRIAKKEKPRHTHQKYIAGTDDLPRTFMRRPFDLDLEVEGALKMTESFAPRGKSAMIYLWSGDTTPFEGAIKATRKAGVRNINGGDSRLDAEYPSVAYVPPISRPAGLERQIYAVNSNENTYTNDWTGPYFGYRKLSETLRNTENPRRLKGFNIYYHMYSGEKPAALDAVLANLQLARASEIAPIPASRYAAIADSFFEVEISETGYRTWQLGKRGELGTVRFERASRLAVDYDRSRGVLGHTHKGEVLYVALDGEVEEAIVALIDIDRFATETVVRPPVDLLVPEMAVEPRQVVRPYLVGSRWTLAKLERARCGFTVQAEGFGKGQMVWAGLEPGLLAVTARRGEGVLWQQEVAVDASGQARFAVDAVAIEPLTIEARCRPSR